MHSSTLLFTRGAGTLLLFSMQVVIYRFAKPPFGLSVSPFYMQMLTNTIVQRFRNSGLTVWNLTDDFMLGHLDQTVLSAVLTDLCRANIHVSWRKSILTPTRRLTVLGAIFDTIKNTVTLSEERKQIIDKIFQILDSATRLRKLTLQIFLEHLGYVWPFIKAPRFLLHPLYLSIDTGVIPHVAVRRAHMDWMENLKSISLLFIFDEPDLIFVDATPWYLD